MSVDSPGIEPDSQDEDRNPVDVLADEFARRIRAGETPSIDEYATKFPEHAGEIRAVLPAIAKIEKASRHQLSKSGSMPANQVVDLNLEKIGDFQIIRQIGLGGMGIVYEALQVSLQRKVALKVISPVISNSPKQLARFKREAATAASLHHTNIVPVFGSGEEDGIHYYAMQLIDGIPLHEAVRNLRQTQSFDFESTASTFFSDTLNKAASSLSPAEASAENRPIAAVQVPRTQRDLSAPTVENVQESSEDSVGSHSSAFNGGTEKQKAIYRSRVCECIADIADALNYAHEQGVLHRDIKPSNLLMDQNGTVWVTDFGLAKFDDHDGITRTGDIVGTLRYMSPEQFSGDGDARSDVCSLGLTLFEMLVLQPAYSETRSAPLMKLKTELDPPSPRKYDPHIPKDLETIVLKACAADPKHRYQTAGDFRDDLLRFIEGRSITARRASLLEQSWRWSKRNPLIASLASLSVLLLVAVAVVAVIGNQMTKTALNEKEIEFERAEQSKIEAQNALAQAREQKRLADANFSVAIRAFEEIMENISRRGIPNGIAVEVEQEEVRSFETSLTNSDVEVLETLLAFFEEFAEQNKTDLTYQSAQAYRRVAEIQQSLGRLVEAEQTFEQAINSFKSLGENILPAEDNNLVQMRILNEVAYCANRRGEFEMAEKSLQRGKSLYDLSGSNSPELKLEYARSLNIFTSMYTRVGYVVNRRINLPQKNQNRNFKSREPNPKNNRTRNKPNKPATKRQKVWVTINNLYAEKKVQIRSANRNAIEILTKLIEQDDENSTYQLELSRAYQNSVRINRYAKDQKSVEFAFKQAIEILTELAKKHENNPAYQFELADLYCNLEKSKTGMNLAGRAFSVARELKDKWPSVSEYQALYAQVLARNAMVRAPINKRRLEESVGIFRELVNKYPDYYAYKINFSQYVVILATQYAIGNEPNLELARQLFGEAEVCLKSMESDGDNDELIKRIARELELAKKSAIKENDAKAPKDDGSKNGRLKDSDSKVSNPKLNIGSQK